mmetsp:Transcript_25401/g.47738  ORF Transcript_25401/g.47738 Transcript_25401/m.47738 type:complete len:207 (+) Transcript_25401:34-654(+)
MALQSTRLALSAALVPLRLANALSSSLLSPMSATAPLHTQILQSKGIAVNFTQRRLYRGAAGEGRASEPKGIDSAMQEKSLKADREIRERHFAMPEATADSDAVTVRRKRLIYRSKQRGWLEVDVLLGTWAHQNVPNLSPTQLDEFEALVNEETIDIYNLLTLRTNIPDHLDNETIRGIQEWCEGHPMGKASVEKYKDVKKEAGLT